MCFDFDSTPEVIRNMFTFVYNNLQILIERTYLFSISYKEKPTFFL